MNLREKFFWNAVVMLSAIVILWNGWGLYNQHQKSSNLLKKYNSDTKEVGADKELEIMVKKMEQNLSDRQNMKFLIKDNPVDLTKVVSVDGIASSKGQKGIECTGIYTPPNGMIIADCNYKGQRYELAKGDSIGGGVVSSINKEFVSITKGGELLKFNVGY